MRTDSGCYLKVGAKTRERKREKKISRLIDKYNIICILSAKNLRLHIKFRNIPINVT